MPFVIIKGITLFSRFKLFWDICLFYFFHVVCWKKNNESDCFVVCFKLFSVLWFGKKIYVFPIVLAYEWYFLLFFMDFFQYFHGLVQLLSHTENTCQHCFVSFLVAFLSFTHLGDSVYDAPRLKLPYEICNVVPQHNQTHNRYRSLIVPKSSWYLFKSLLKISWIISFISLLIIISRFRSYQGFFTSLLVT